MAHLTATMSHRRGFGLAAPTSGRALVGGRRYDGLIRPLREVGSLLDATALHAAAIGDLAAADGIAVHALVPGRPRWKMPTWT